MTKQEVIARLMELMVLADNTRNAVIELEVALERMVHVLINDDFNLTDDQAMVAKDKILGLVVAVKQSANAIQ